MGKEPSKSPSQPASCWPKLSIGDGCTYHTPEFGAGASGAARGPSTSPHIPAPGDILGLLQQSSASTLPSVFSLLTPQPPPTPKRGRGFLLSTRLLLCRPYSTTSPTQASGTSCLQRPEQRGTASLILPSSPTTSHSQDRSGSPL